MAGIITAGGVLALLITAVAALVTAKATLNNSKRVEKKVDSVHVLVNQQRTDMQNYIRALTRALKMNDIDVPVDQSVPETGREV